MRNGEPRRVLVVEDEMLVAMMLEDMLTELGYSVVGPASNVEKALQFARDADLDIAVLDVNVHGVQSFPVAEVLESRGIPFIFATGYGTRGLVERYSGVETLKKPFSQEELEQALASA